MVSKTPRIAGGPPEHKVTKDEKDWSRDWTQGERFTTKEEKKRSKIRERAESERKKREAERVNWVDESVEKNGTGMDGTDTCS